MIVTPAIRVAACWARSLANTGHHTTAQMCLIASVGRLTAKLLTRESRLLCQMLCHLYKLYEEKRSLIHWLFVLRPLNGTQLTVGARQHVQGTRMNK